MRKEEKSKKREKLVDKLEQIKGELLSLSQSWFFFFLLLSRREREKIRSQEHSTVPTVGQKKIFPFCCLSLSLVKDRKKKERERREKKKKKRIQSSVFKSFWLASRVIIIISVCCLCKKSLWKKKNNFQGVNSHNKEN